MTANGVPLLQFCLKMDVSSKAFCRGWVERIGRRHHRMIPYFVPEGKYQLFFGSGIEMSSHKLWEDFIPLMSTKCCPYASNLGPWRPAWESSLHWLCSSCWMWHPLRIHGRKSRLGAPPPPGGPLSSDLLPQNSQSRWSPRTSLQSSWDPSPCTQTALGSVSALLVTPIPSTVRTGTSGRSLASRSGPTTCTCRTTSSRRSRRRRSAMPPTSAGSTCLTTEFTR